MLLIYHFIERGSVVLLAIRNVLEMGVVGVSPAILCSLALLARLNVIDELNVRTTLRREHKVAMTAAHVNKNIQEIHRLKQKYTVDMAAAQVHRILFISTNLFILTFQIQNSYSRAAYTMLDVYVHNVPALFHFIHLVQCVARHFQHKSGEVHE